jgi:hypothetical protein
VDQCGRRRIFPADVAVEVYTIKYQTTKPCIRRMDK